VLSFLMKHEPTFAHIGYKSLLAQDEVYEADEVTWGAFESKYGLTHDDEKAFEKKLHKLIKQKGLNVIVDSWQVEMLAEVEAGSVL